MLGTKFASVNLVNVRDMANQRGINIKETRTDSAGDYQAVIRILVSNACLQPLHRWNHDGGSPSDYRDQGHPAGKSTLGRYMLYITNKDQPGLIGAVGSRMAESGINIANFHLGRLSPGRGRHCLSWRSTARSARKTSRSCSRLPQIDRCPVP